MQIQKFESEIYQKKLFIRFIYSKIPTLADKTNYQSEDLIRIYKTFDQDIIFDNIDFQKFCRDYFKKYEKRLLETLITDLSNLILINECLDGTLIYEKDHFMNKFTFIVNKNYEIIREPVNKL